MWGGQDAWAENAPPVVIQKVNQLEDDLNAVRTKLQQKVFLLATHPSISRKVPILACRLRPVGGVSTRSPRWRTVVQQRDV